MDIAKHWKTIVDTLQDGLLVIGPDGTIIAVNPAAERLQATERMNWSANRAEYSIVRVATSSMKGPGLSGAVCFPKAK